MPKGKSLTLTRIIIPDSVTEVGWEAFARCTALETVTFGVGIKKIEADTFEGCTSLKTINVPANKADYYKKHLPEKLHHLIVELPAEKKEKK